MTKQIHVQHDETNYTTQVRELSKVEKMHLASRAPDSLHQAAETESGEIDITIDEKIVEFFIETVCETTTLDKETVEPLPVGALMAIGKEVFKVLFEDGSADTFNERRLKRVCCTEEFIETLFTGKAGIVAGMPDDASLESFEYNPARMQFEFIFSSDEWDHIDEGAVIPVHDAAAVELGNSTKNL